MNEVVKFYFWIRKVEVSPVTNKTYPPNIAWKAAMQMVNAGFTVPVK